MFGDFLSFPGKIRAGLGAVGLFKAPAPSKEESVKEFISRNLGEEVFYRLIEPFCSGVYAGDPTKLSMKAAFGKIHALEEKAGSLVGGGLKLAEERKANPGPPRPEKLPPKPAGQTVGSFREGLQTLPEAIAKELDNSIRCDWKLTAVSKGSDGIYELEYSTPEGTQTVRTRSVALTAPSYVVANLLGGQVPALADALNSIDYPPVCAVTLAYPEAAVKVRVLAYTHGQPEHLLLCHASAGSSKRQNALLSRVVAGSQQGGRLTPGQFKLATAVPNPRLSGRPLYCDSGSWHR